MIAMNIHDVSSIRITETREQTVSTTSYVRHLVIRSKDGELNISLYADNKESLAMPLCKPSKELAFRLTAKGVER